MYLKKSNFYIQYNNDLVIRKCLKSKGKYDPSDYAVYIYIIQESWVQDKLN